ncbi:MAG: lysophospholipid acyltransferase family protein [Balneolales bacterium]
MKSEPSRLFIFFFRYYVKLLFSRRFNRVWLDQNYRPDENRSTVYFLNHNSWWDGIIPLLLNEFRFGQRAGAIMNEVQIRKHPFFKKIGAYAIDRNNPRKAIKTLHETVNFLDQKGTCLFLYPQGSLMGPCEPIVFEGGISWLHDHCDTVDFVPVALHQHTYYSDKPSLFIKTGKPVAMDKTLTKSEKNRIFEHSLKDLLINIRKESFTEDPDFDRLA